MQAHVTLVATPNELKAVKKRLWRLIKAKRKELRAQQQLERAKEHVQEVMAEIASHREKRHPGQTCSDARD